MAINISVIHLNAPIQKVWTALTDPQIVKQWQYGSELITDWKVGSDIRFSAEWEGKVFEQWGKILEFIPNKMLKYSLFAPRPDLEDKPENYFTMTYKVTSNNGHIKLEIVQEDNRKGAVQNEPQDEENPILKNLKSIIEN
jgi:uncharacterized protein YndB with AHSA1/START domain